MIRARDRPSFDYEGKEEEKFSGATTRSLLSTRGRVEMARSVAGADMMMTGGQGCQQPGAPIPNSSWPGKDGPVPIPSSDAMIHGTRLSTRPRTMVTATVCACSSK